jgi:hypothetical protein
MSLRKFNQGEFKKTIVSLLSALWFMMFPYTLFIVREVIPLSQGNADALSWAIYGCMTIVAIYILRSAILFRGFSNVFAFGGGK